MRFKGKKIFKDEQTVEREAKISFYYKDVKEFEDYIYEDYFKNNAPKVHITVLGRTHVILCSYDKFELLLSKFEKERKVLICN